MSEATVNDNAAVKNEKGARKVRSGYVVSTKMNKTIVVELEDRKQHALYGKIMRRNSRVKVHDENETAGVGDDLHAALHGLIALNLGAVAAAALGLGLLVVGLTL